MIGVSSGRSDISSEEYARVRIHGNHAFSVLAAHTLDHHPSLFVLVRDPHSHSSYTEESVTQHVLKQLHSINPAEHSTGAFWISWARFLRYFSSITISTYDSEHFDVREQGKFTSSSTQWIVSYRFHLPKYTYMHTLFLFFDHFVSRF